MNNRIYFTKRFLREQQNILFNHLQLSGCSVVLTVIDTNHPNLNIRYFMCKDENRLKELVDSNELYSIQAVENALNDDFNMLFLEHMAVIENQEES